MTEDINDCQVISLNIGGTKYMTTVRTLMREENTFFTDLLKSDCNQHENVATKLPDGAYFIDRDGELFVYILDYMRTGKLLLPDNFKDTARLKEEVMFYKLENMNELLLPYFNLKYPGRLGGGQINGNTALQNTCETGGFITLGYRGTFAFGRDGQADVKFRKLHRILVCGKVALCREVFADTLNESRDPDREGSERYTSRLYLKHQCLERACDNLAEKGFKLVATCSSGANGLATAGFSVLGAQINTGAQDFVNQRNSGDFEEQRWAHYTEYVFYREPQLATSVIGSDSK